jgi:polyketide synthase PksN
MMRNWSLPPCHYNDDDQVTYEIVSIEGGQQTVHCHGEAVWNHSSVPDRLDLKQLQTQMRNKLEASEIYAICAKMGLNYGPAHQGIVGMYLGQKQLLAQLHLPRLSEQINVNMCYIQV